MKQITQSIFKAMLPVAMLLQVSEPVSAQNFAYIGTGATYNDGYTYPAPYGHYYWYSRHQFFITAAEIAASGVTAGSQINGVAFNVQGLNNMGYIGVFNGVNIYTTTLTNPLQTALVTTGQVATGAISTNYQPSLGWNEHPVTGPYTWNGTDNLVIETCHHSTPYTYNASTYWTTSLTGTEVKSRWWYQDGIYTCQNSGFAGSSTTTRPNIRLNWAPACSTTPGPNAVQAPTFMICPNSTVALGLASSYTVGNLTYQWYASTATAVGPFSSVSVNGNGATYVPTVTVNTWYQVVIGCPMASTVMATVGMVSVSPTTTNTVPYFEGFEGIGLNDRMPNCSWASSGYGSTTRTYTAPASGNRVPHSGNMFAAFSNTAGTHHYYTNGIWLEAGVTYSAALWYTTDLAGSSNWQNLRILYGTSQSSTGLTQIATVNGAVISPNYKLLSNVFTVPTPGLYYVAVRATGGSGGAPYLSWDDLSITIPCTPPHNPVNVNASTTTNTICTGQSVLLNAVGADTYNWVGVGTGQSITDTPQSSQTYTVIGTNTLTGCTGQAMLAVSVNQSPNVYGVAYPAMSCPGMPVTLVANGNAVTYMWSAGGSGSIVTVAPTSSGTFAVSGTGANGCQALASVSVIVNQNPVVTGNASNANICKGNAVVLTGFGATTYNWMSSNGSLTQGASVTTYPASPTTYTLSGTDGNGCTGTALVSVNVEACTGINAIQNNAGFSFYPNPAYSEISIASPSRISRVEVTDLSGRVVATSVGGENAVKMDISSLSNGIYHVTVVAEGSSATMKMVKE